MTSTEQQPDSKRPKLVVAGGGLVQLAEQAVAAHPESNVEIALAFLQPLLPDFCRESFDRLVKVGRSLRGIVKMSTLFDSQHSYLVALELALEECRILLEVEREQIRVVPTVRFGKTQLQMPILTLGCMRFQQQWGTDIQNMNQVYSDCQDNLSAILKRAWAIGMVHIETAWGYGCSELQLGVALKQLFLTGQSRREDWILQTKVGPKEDPADFREMLEQSFARLQVDYLDLFAFHGLNEEWQWEWMFRADGENCWTIVQEYVQAGKIRHVGFSTHGPTEWICKLIKTDKFDYVNLHHHFCGSYTASGDGPDGTGNIKCLRLLKEKDMGAFIISPLDKGGKLYAPSRKLRSLTLPDLEPMTYGLGWLWNLHQIDQQGAQVHTTTIGCARPADLDQCAVAAYYQRKGELTSKVHTVSTRLEKAKVEALGQEWIDTCYQGAIKSRDSKYMIEHNQIIWMYNLLLAWGLHGFAKDRYKSLCQNRKKYDPALSNDDNIDAIGRNGWGFVPGLNPEPGKDYFQDDLSGVPAKNRARFTEAYEFVTKWCAPPLDGEPSYTKGGRDKPNAEPNHVVIYEEWETAYEMKPWKDFPDRPYPL